MKWVMIYAAPNRNWLCFNKPFYPVSSHEALCHSLAWLLTWLGTD
jgi:hypothetical protein